MELLAHAAFSYLWSRAKSEIGRELGTVVPTA